MAQAFADELVALLEEAGMWARATEPEDPREHGPHRMRRSGDALHKVQDRILSELRKYQKPVAISVLARPLGLGPRAVAHPLALLVARGLVLRTGEKRGARYALAGHRADARGRKKAPAR